MITYHSAALRSGTLSNHFWGAVGLCLLIAAPVFAQSHDECQAPPRAARKSAVGTAQDCRSSEYAPPAANDQTFVADCDDGLDTGCVYKKDVPNRTLTIRLEVTRRLDRSRLTQLVNNGLLSPMAQLELPAFDVDYYGGSNENRPERDLVRFNGQRVPGDYLTGENGKWKMNSFTIPIAQINFATDRGPNRAPAPGINYITIEIDTANPADRNVWCTAVDWVALKFEAARPLVFVHGILANGEGWDGAPFRWVTEMNRLGLPNNGTSLSMGYLPDTIQDNAAEVGATVEQLRLEWGTDKVSLVCHSKGGLDARHFAEHSDTIDQLIQLGTPNAGAPLADYLLKGSLKLPPLWALAVNAPFLLDGRGGYQLTTKYMAAYNLLHSYNPAVRYTSLAGHYHANCASFGCRVLQSLWDLSYGGISDGIVPVWSVHSLRYSQHLLFAPPAEQLDEAFHTALNNSPSVYARLGNRPTERVTQLLAAATALHEAAPESRPAAPALDTALAEMVNASSVAGVLRQGQTQMQSLVVDQATLTAFTLIHSAGNLELTLIAPSGLRYSPANVTNHPNVQRDDRPLLSGRAETYFFQTTELGLWRAEISAVSVTGEAAYVLGLWAEKAALSFTVAAIRAAVRAGEPLQVTGTLRYNNAPLTGAVVTARAVLPDKAERPLTLRDDGASGDSSAGDGVYTANLTATAQAGNYLILLHAARAGVGGVPAFVREELLTATVSRSASVFTGAYRDYGADTDNDGLFNHLVIEAEINVTVAGAYRVLGVLTDTRGNTHEAAGQGTVSAGGARAVLEFNGAAIFRNGVDGPYRLTLRLAEEDGVALLPVDERRDVYQTRFYATRAFQRSPVRLTGGGSARGVDTNNNGRFEFLDVSLEVDFAFGGDYDWSARLEDGARKEIGFATNARAFAAGVSFITLRFLGEEIGRNGVNGPYFVRGLLLGGGGRSAAVAEAFTITGFSAGQFEFVGRATNVSAASYSASAVAPESIVAAFGIGFASEVRAATTVPLPTALLGTTVRIRDVRGSERLAPLFFVSREQVNYQLPAGTAPGAATATITRSDGATAAGALTVAAVAPGLFSADASGTGLPAATVLRVKANGAQLFEPVVRYDETLNRFVAVPIDLGPATDQVFLLLFGTGWRGRGSLAGVTVRVAGVNTEVLYAGPQGDFVGLDQLNARLPRSLAGRGEVDFALTVDGRVANTVRVSFR